MHFAHFVFTDIFSESELEYSSLFSTCPVVTVFIFARCLIYNGYYVSETVNCLLTSYFFWQGPQRVHPAPAQHVRTLGERDDYVLLHLTAFDPK
jgi:hypothetical protein